MDISPLFEEFGEFLGREIVPFGVVQELLSSARMKSLPLLIFAAILVALVGGGIGRGNNRVAVEKKLAGRVAASGITGKGSGGGTVVFDHFTGVVSGRVNSEEERRTLLARLRESIGAGRLSDHLERTVAPVDPVAQRRPGSETIPQIPPSMTLLPGNGLAMILSGVVPSEDVKSGWFEAVRRSAPELLKVENQIIVKPGVTREPWVDLVPDFLERVFAGVQRPEIRVEASIAMIGGVTDDKAVLKSLRNEFSALLPDGHEIHDELELDEAMPSPQIRLPLVLYVGQNEGKFYLEGSLPVYLRRLALVDAVVAARGSESVVDRLVVSTHTVEEAWMDLLPGLTSALFDPTTVDPELTVVDRTVTVSGVVPDKELRNAIVDPLAAAEAAGYTVIDQLTVKP